MSGLPERINVMKVVSYDVTQILQDIRDMNETMIPFGKSDEEVTTEDILNFIEDWVREDFSHCDIRELIYQDENGNDL